jgi:glycosyltransferase involved in cell wall biosynthesis
LCLIIPTLDNGGAEKQLCLLATGLDRARFEPHVITLTRDGPRRTMLDQAGVPVVSIGKRSKFDPTAIFRLTNALSRLRPDIVHTWIFAANSYGRLAALWAKVPVILGGERSVDPWKRWHHFWIDRRLAGRTAGIITNSSGVQEFYHRHRIDRDRFFVIPNGVERPAAPRVNRQEVMLRLGLSPDTILFGSVGRLWPQKGYKDLIWVAEMVQLVHPRAHFAIVGDGPLRKRLEQYCDQLGAAKALRFYGERQDVADLLPHLHVYVNGSLYEGQSNAILEAMSAGVPVVASDIPGNRDLVIHGQTGFLCGVGDVYAFIQALDRLLKDDELRQRMGAAGQERITEHFSIPTMVARHMDLYERLFAAKKS